MVEKHSAGIPRYYQVAKHAPPCDRDPHTYTVTKVRISENVSFKEITGTYTLSTVQFVSRAARAIIYGLAWSLFQDTGIRLNPEEI